MPSVEIAGDRPALDQRLPLPGSAARHIVAQRGVERAGQRPLLAVGAQPHVDAIGDSQRRVVGQQPDELAPHPGEELGVGDDLGPAVCAILVVQEDQIDVGAVVELLAAQLAQAQHDEPCRRSAAVTRNAEASLGASPRQPQRRFDAGVGQVGKVLRDQFQRKTAHDVVVADPQALAARNRRKAEPARSRRTSPETRVPQIVDQRRSVRAPGLARSQSSSSGSRINTSLKYWLVLKTCSRISVVRGLVREVAASVESRACGTRRQEPFEVRQRHPRIGAARQNGVEQDRQPGDVIQSTRDRPAGSRSARSRHRARDRERPARPASSAPARGPRGTSETSRRSCGRSHRNV